MEVLSTMAMVIAVLALIAGLCALGLLGLVVYCISEHKPTKKLETKNNFPKLG